MHIKEYLKKNKIIMDGAMGTYFARKQNDGNMVSEFANLSDPQLIESIHMEYIEAGAKLIRTNSFAANQGTLRISTEEQVSILTASYEIAKRAANGREDVFIAGDIGPIREDAAVDETAVLAEYKRMCDVFIGLGADIILFETFSDLKYIRDLVKYIKSKGDIFIITDFCLNKNGYTSAGISAVRLFNEINMIDEIDACGFNCGIGSGHMYQILKRIPLNSSKFLVSVPNAGYPEQLHNRMVFIDNADYFCENMKMIAELGLDIVGGCCGTTPEYIQKLAESIELKQSGSHREIKASADAVREISFQNPFYEKFKTGKKVVAVELDPPFDAGYDKILDCALALKDKGTDIITIADSPMGRSRVDSVMMGILLSQETGLPVMPHICCRDKNMISMRSSLLGAYIHGVRNLLLVTGDPVPSVSRASVSGVFDYNSIQLMNFVKEMNEEHFTEEPLCYGGALNYGRGNIEKVIERMEKKIAAGAKYFLTQPVYSDEDIERIRILKSRVDTKILCGIMPLVSYRNANFIKNELTGIHVPDSIMERYREDMSKEEGEVTGAAIANEIIERLSGFADGYYFMLPFNRVSLMDKIIVK